MVCLALRFYATGEFFQVAGDFAGVDKSTACRIIHKVSVAIASLGNRYINMPVGNELITVKNNFYAIARFPKCIGAIDCTHIKIQSPGGDNAEIYRNRKGIFSLNVQVVGDTFLRIRNIVCRWQGSAHDSTIFNNSQLRRLLENRQFGDSVLVGDSGYAIKPYLITPLKTPETPAEMLFNEAQIRTRNPIERLFGVWKRRFPILSRGIRVQLNKIEAIIVATAVLQNIAVELKDGDPPHLDEEVIEEGVAGEDFNNAIEENPQLRLNDVVRRTLITQHFQNLL